MQTVFFWWLILATIALGFIGIVWSKKGWINLFLKSIYIALAGVGGIVIYHALILNQPL